jgi:hypothetical protein
MSAARVTMMLVVFLVVRIIVGRILCETARHIFRRSP